jgi:hypothetical protein
MLKKINWLGFVPVVIYMGIIIGAAVVLLFEFKGFS